MEPYRHTQISSILIGILLLVATITVAVQPTRWSLPLLLPALVVLLLFGWLTVTVDEGAVALRFGVGLIRRRIPLTTIETWDVVRNPWWYGWGIRVYPGGILYNVAGLSAVQIGLADGRRLRIGSDEPDALAAVLARRLGDRATSGAAAPVTAVRRGPWWLIVVFNILVLGAVLVAIAVQRRPPSVVVSESAVTISAGYGDTIAVRDITDVSLEARLPRVERRTNGFALGQTLRGSFDLAGIGHARLFVTRDVPPYVRIRTAGQVFYVNYDDPSQTRALYEEVTAAAR